MRLHKSIFKGLLWNLTDNFSVRIIQFISEVYMARILSPSDYGLMGMLLIFTVLSDTIMNGGFSTALIQKVDRTDTDTATAFYFNIGVSILLYGCLFFSAPAIAAFYKAPILEDLVKVAAIPFVINALFLVQRTYLTIQMDFKRLAKISVIAALIKGITGILMAYGGWGVWAIAWSNVVGVFVSCLLFWRHSVWKLSFHFSMQSFRELFGFGSKLMLSGILNTLGSNLYTLVIGKRFASTELGYYTRASSYSSLPSMTLTGVLSRVTFPMLSQIQNEDERLTHVYRQLLRLSAFVVFPLMTGIALLAHPLIALILTIKWLPCMEYMQILCFALMLYPIHALNLNLLQVKGRSDLFLRLEIFKLILSFSVLMIAIPYGIRTLCIGEVISSFIAWGINAYYTGKLIGVNFLRQLLDLCPTIIYVGLMSSCIYVILQFIESYIGKLVWGTITGIISYYVITSLFHSKELTYLQTILIHKKEK